MATPVRVLIVDDSEDDTLLLVRELRRGGYDPTFLRVDSESSMAAALARDTWDLIICDYAMPGFSGPAALDLLQKTGLDLPFILVSGYVGEETGVPIMTAGAHDFIRKNRPTRLVPVIERELREARQRAERRRAAEALEKYLSPKAYELIRDGELSQVGGYSREITVFKTDIRDFTALAETMEPEELLHFLNRYFTHMVAVVHKHGGEVDKYMGDAVLAKFGATEWYPDHARRAVLAMTEMIEECAAFGEELQQEGRQTVIMGIGCNTGPAIVGNLGSPERMEYTVISSTVNAAQRIEELCKELGWDLLISGATYEQASDAIEVGDPIRTRLRGQSHDVLVYPVLGRAGEVPEKRLAAYRALRALGWLSPAAPPPVQVLRSERRPRIHSARQVRAV